MKRTASGMLPAKLSKAQIQEVYRSKVDNYDAWGKYTESRAQDRCFELAAVQDGEQILEVAVGTGTTFERLLRQNPGGWTVGIDLTDGMLAQALQKAAATGNERYSLQLGDAYHLPFETNRFDLLVNHYMFDMLPEADFARVLAEFQRVLRPGGRLAVVSMAIPCRWYHHTWDMVYRLGAKSMGGCRGVSLAGFVASAGFTIQHHETISQFSFPSEIIIGVKP